MADKSIADLPVSGSMTDDALLALYQNGTTNSITGALIKSYAQNAVASQVTAAQTAANQAGQSATQAEAARQGAAAAQTAAESAQDAAETARDQSVAAAGTIGDSVEQAQTAAGQASSAKDAAVAAQTAAETAKTAAETASGQAQTAATQASGSATAAQAAATQAGDAKTDAETARNEAETSASSAANSASDAEIAATEAEQAKTYIENMDMEGETLPAGSSVTVTKTTSPEGNLLFVIGVPQGIQGDKGNTGETGATGPQGVSVTNATVNEDGDLVITLSAGEPINAGSVIGPRGIQGEVGPTGASVDRIERTSGTGAPGTTDTYTVYLTDGKTGGTFQVYNGSNGAGAGDFMADGSVPMTGDIQMGGHKITNLAEPTDNTDAASKEYVDDTITVSLVGNYIPVGQKGQANGVASLDDSGKVPSAQLPPMDYVPTSRTVNGHALSADVTLDAEDVGAIPNPTGGTAGQVLTKTADGSSWEDAPSGLPDGGSEGQMLYKGANGAEWGIPPYLGSMPQLDYSQMKSLHALGITDLNDVTEPGTYVGMNGASYPNIANLPSAVAELDIPFVLNVYSLTGPSGTDYAGYNGIFQNLFCISDIYAGHIRNFWRGGMSIGTGGVTFPYGWNLETDANNISFTPTSTLTSENVQDAIDEVQENVENVLPSGGTPGQVLTKTSTGEEWSDAPSGLPEGGTEGQILEKTSSGAAWVDKPESGLTQEQADERYLQLTGGELNDDAIFQLPGDNGSLYLGGRNNVPNVGMYASSSGYITLHDNTMGNVNIRGVRSPEFDYDAANKAYVDSKSPTSVAITLTTSGWSSNTQTVTVSGVSATETAQLITPTPAIASQSAYYEAGIMCTGQAANSLTFTCQTVPTSNLTVYVVIQPLS